MKTNGAFHTLKYCILESIKHSFLHPEFADALLTQDKTHALNKNETEFWDYKEDINFDNSEDIAKLASRILAFHNSQGGCIIFGIKKNYVVSGFYKNKIIDSVTLKNKLKRYLGNTVNIFQEQFEIPINSKVIYLIFVPKRKTQPVPVHTNGPEINGKPIIKRDDYYIRIGDECKVCREPNDYERLFLDASFKHIAAYQYELDIPYYRLLAPHHRRLIGRDQNIAEVISVLNQGRHFIISLDGVGGVGKSALAIEALKKIYGNGDDCKYQFIISASAKNKVWHNKIETRQAGFSGLDELIEIIAQVFDLDMQDKNTSELKSEIISLMTGTPGIIFLDNLEDINDNQVWKFLTNEVPDPVKILVTSRTKRDIGALPIPVPQMDKDDARSLFYEELEFFKYYNYFNEENEVNEILEATGYLPLAIKWAASMIIHCKNLKVVSSQFRQASSTRKSFLDFCFSTMYDGLSSLARETALCFPFLSENANSSNISILLQKANKDIDDAMSELEDKGLIFFHSDTQKERFFILPLTIDFLSEKLNQDGNFRMQLIEISAENEGIHLPKSQQVEVYYRRANMLESKNENLSKALVLTSGALQTIAKENIDVSPKILHSLKFLEGKIIYKLKQFNKGIFRMMMAIDKENEIFFVPNDFIFLCSAVFNHGSGQDEQKALRLFAKYYSIASATTKELFEEYLIRIKKGNKKDSLDIFFKNLSSPQYAYWFSEFMWNEITDNQSALILGNELISTLKLAAIFNGANDKIKQEFVTRIIELQDLFRKLK
jgi:Schlafen, AlbA_2/NB-ARC domain